MLESIRFSNYKVLRDTYLRLGAFTVVVGPNASGKSTALSSFAAVKKPGAYDFKDLVSAGAAIEKTTAVRVAMSWGKPADVVLTTIWTAAGERPQDWSGPNTNSDFPRQVLEDLRRTRVFSLDPEILSQPVALQPKLELGPKGNNFAGVLDALRDQAPERFENLNEELTRLLPEFDRVLFETPENGQRAFRLRTRAGYAIAARDLSQGTLFALAMLTLAHLPEPPPLIGIEDPDRGIHPRLLREVRDALYRLSYPESYGENRKPVQVIATTHSPYFLDLFKDHPEEIVIAERVDSEAKFERLVDRPDVNEILADAALGEVWYSGVLGGVPAKP